MNGLPPPALFGPDARRVLERSSWFASLDPAFRQGILDGARAVRVAPGAYVFHRGDADDGVYCVLAGAVCLGGVSGAGKGAIVAIAEAPQWFGEVALFDGGVRTHDAWVEVESQLLHLPARRLARLLAENPSRWKAMGALLAGKLRIALAMHESLALEPPAVRLARCLVDLLEGYGLHRRTDATELRVTQEQLGMLLSLSRQTVNELLGDLEQRGIIERLRGRIRIVDVLRLQERVKLAG